MGEAPVLQRIRVVKWFAHFPIALMRSFRTVELTTDSRYCWVDVESSGSQYGQRNTRKEDSHGC